VARTQRVAAEALGQQAELRPERPLELYPGRGDEGLAIEPLQDRGPAGAALDAQPGAVEARVPGDGTGDAVDLGRVGAVVIAQHAQHHTIQIGPFHDRIHTGTSVEVLERKRASPRWPHPSEDR